MENRENSSVRDLRALSPTRENALSHILNGIGNSTMLAAIPALLLNNDQRGRYKNHLYIGTAIAVVLGALWGWREAKQIANYRTALVDQVEQLHQNVAELRAENANWREKWAAREAAEAKASNEIIR